MTYNPETQLNIIKGKINFEESNINDYQNLLNSFDVKSSPS